MTFCHKHTAELSQIEQSVAHWSHQSIPAIFSCSVKWIEMAYCNGKSQVRSMNGPMLHPSADIETKLEPAETNAFAINYFPFLSSDVWSIDFRMILTVGTKAHQVQSILIYSAFLSRTEKSRVDWRHLSCSWKKTPFFRFQIAAKYVLLFTHGNGFSLCLQPHFVAGDTKNCL